MKLAQTRYDITIVAN